MTAGTGFNIHARYLDGKKEWVAYRPTKDNAILFAQTLARTAERMKTGAVVVIYSGSTGEEVWRSDRT